MSAEKEILAITGGLYEKAEEMDKLIKKARQALKKLEEAAEGTEACFQGKAASQFRKKIKSKGQKGEELLRKLDSFPLKLRQIAQQYEKAERENKNVLMGNGSLF